MKAISLWQPWASLIACGAKRFETRHWAPPLDYIGKPLAIHAAKKVDKEAAAFAEDIMYGQHHAGGFDLAEKLDATMEDVPDHLMQKFGHAVMPTSCIVAIVRLEAAFKLGPPIEDGSAASITTRMTHRAGEDLLTVPYDTFGDYGEGRWAWLLKDVKPLTPPVAEKGRQGFWELPQGWLTGSTEGGA